MTKPLYDVPTMCGIMGCLKTRPCPEHGKRKPAPISAQRRALSRSGWRWSERRRQVIRRDGGRCQLCPTDRPTPGSVVDHILPIIEGGTDDLGNLQLLCTPCHNAKTRREARARAERNRL